MGKALGMIETRGLIGSIEAADTMLKAADVRLIKLEKVDAALVTVLIEGDVGAVQAAVEAGEIAAARVGELISSRVIPNPDEGVARLIQQETLDQQLEQKNGNGEKLEPKPTADEEQPEKIKQSIAKTEKSISKAKK